MDLPSWVDQEAWDAFVEMRKKLEKTKKTPWTPGAEKGALRDLGKLYMAGEDPTEVLWQSATRGWAGLFEVKNKPQRQVQREYVQEPPEPPQSPERRAEVQKALRDLKNRLVRH